MLVLSIGNRSTIVFAQIKESNISRNINTIILCVS